VAYSDTVGDNAYLLKKTLRGVMDFAGRSRRTEVIYYWIATALFGVVVSFGIMLLAPFESLIRMEALLQAALAIPMFALLVRRLHDQNRSGWWGLLLPLALVLSVREKTAEVQGNSGALLAEKTSATAVALDLVYLAVLVLFLWPGTEGPNQFGPDPRLEEV
jgi:uncharacterized membrane protein YhaH (DUF805 family)